MNQLAITGCTELSAESVGQMMILKDGTFYTVTDQDFQIFSMAHKAVDVNAELNVMVAWLYSNPSKRKTKGGIKRFMNSWLSRAKTPQPQTHGYQPVMGSTRTKSLESDLTDRSWAD